MKLRVRGYTDKSEWALDSGLPNSLMLHWDQAEVKSQGSKTKPSRELSVFHPYIGVRVPDFGAKLPRFESSFSIPVSLSVKE